MFNFCNNYLLITSIFVGTRSCVFCFAFSDLVLFCWMLTRNWWNAWTSNSQVELVRNKKVFVVWLQLGDSLTYQSNLFLSVFFFYSKHVENWVEIRFVSRFICWLFEYVFLLLFYYQKIFCNMLFLALFLSGQWFQPYLFSLSLSKCTFASKYTNKYLQPLQWASDKIYIYWIILSHSLFDCFLLFTCH